MTWTEEEIKNSRQKYGITIVKANCDPKDAEDKSLPTDAYLVEYTIDDETFYDIIRAAKQVKMFDMYWDKFKNGFVGFSWAKGSVNPKMWGYQPPDKKKKR
jgi:hypothetical protein